MATAPRVSWTMLGSLIGGSLGWMLDRALQRHGALAVAFAAITPLPYSVSAWAAGSTYIPYRLF